MFKKTVYFVVFLGAALLFPMSVPAQKQDSTVDVAGVTVSISVPAADPAYIRGRVTDFYGRGLANVRITMFNVNTNAVYVSSTNSFGYYRFLDLPVGDFYVMSPQHKRYLFLEGSVSFQLDGDLTDVDFQASN